MASAKSVPVVTVQIIEKMKNREKIYKLLEVSYCVTRGRQTPGLSGLTGGSLCRVKTVLCQLDSFLFLVHLPWG